MSSFTSFEELDCWKKCRKLRLWLQEFLSDNVPRNDFDMIQNLRRAGRSTTRNIAEGFGRYHFKENIQFCRISRGSLFEIKDDLLICVDEKMVDEETINQGLKLLNQAVFSLNGYIKYLQQRANNP